MAFDYWLLGFAAILVLTDVTLISLKQEIVSIKNKLNRYDVVISSTVSDIDKRTKEAFNRLNQLERVSQIVQERYYIPDNNEEEIFEGEYADYCNDEDGILGYEGEDGDYEG